MDVPYGFDCYAFKPYEVKYLDPSIKVAQSVGIVPYQANSSAYQAQQEYFDEKLQQKMAGYVRFTRKNEDYTPDQLRTLIKYDRLSLNESKPGNQIFCGIKIQIGIGVVTNFLKKGMQYRKPNKGRSELINGTWNGIVSGLTVDRDAPNSYDIAFGNFLAYDEEFPYIKFGPFFAIESKLVMLTGSSRSIEASSFGTNIQSKIWFIILFLMLILSVLASFRVHWQHTKHRKIEHSIEKLFKRLGGRRESNLTDKEIDFNEHDLGETSLPHMLHNFFFIYFTMLLNKPSLEFDDFIWPKHDPKVQRNLAKKYQKIHSNKEIYRILEDNEDLRRHYHEMLHNKRKRKPLPTSIRIVSYLWSAACLVMASIYSGEMLAVILLKADQNIDTIQQLIQSKPPIEPVIRQDDFTYNLMLKSLDTNMLVLHNMTKIVPRPEVYTREFIERVSERKQALLGDDELIETIYDIYHQHFPLYRSKVTYLQYPISIMYRNDLNVTLERKLRKGMVQIFEMGLVSRWYQAQKETYINFYDSETSKSSNKSQQTNSAANQESSKYKPLSMSHFNSFFKLMFQCILVAFLVLALELIHFNYLAKKESVMKL